MFPALRATKAAKGAELERVWTAYAVDYRLEMLDSFETRRAEWDALLSRERCVMVCVCRAAQRCHRTLAAGYLARRGATYCGELSR